MEILCLFVKAIAGGVSAKMLDFHRLSLFCTHGHGDLELPLITRSAKDVQKTILAEIEF